MTVAGSVAVGALAWFTFPLIDHLAWFRWLVAVFALATLLPAVGWLTASVRTDPVGIVLSRFGRHHVLPWADVVDVVVVERRASVPEGTEYHWVMPGHARHLVVAPAIVLPDGTRRVLTALSSRADQQARYADDCAARLLAGGPA